VEFGRLQRDDDQEDGDDRKKRNQDFLQHGFVSGTL
jgi:hypothetical protein